VLTLQFSKSQLGPIVDVSIERVSCASGEASSSPVGDQMPIALKMLIDTGAEQTAIDEAAIDEWGLVYVGMSFVRTMTGTRPVRNYELNLRLTSSNPTGSWHVGSVVVMATRGSFEGVPYRGLIGRDILDRVVFTYNGPAHLCTIHQ
jgi:hypothetical protein